MERPKCAVRNCKEGAMIAYGSKWICGKCMVRLMKKQEEIKERQILELEEWE